MFVTFLMAALLHQTSPLLSYQHMEDLKQKLGGLVVEVEVVLKVPEGADPSIAPRLLGQAVCLRDVSGSTVLLTSAFLVDNHSSLKVRTRAAPNWAEAKILTADMDSGLARLAPQADGFVCPEVLPALPELEASGAVLFSIDNPVAHTSIFFGEIAGMAEPPLQEYLLTGSGLPLGGPLFSIEGKLVALNLRRYTTTSNFNMALSATHLKRVLLGRRRTPGVPARRARRKP